MPQVADDPSHPTRRLNFIVALGVAAIALAVYVRTLYPGVGGGGDATKFQYLGSVLGTAHTPGYPTYVFVSWAFSHLTFGSPAYRMNFMSALLASCAVALVSLVLMRLGVRRWVAACAALGLAFDRYLWSKATGAEVYTLAATLVAVIAWLAVRWIRTGRDRDLYALVLAFGVSLGNHLTVATLAPAVALLVLVVRPQTIRLRVVLISALLVLVGLTQYVFILVRTWQHAPFVEAHASNLRELYGVLRATPYSDQIFAFSVAQLVRERSPLFWEMLRSEFGYVGLVMLAAGVVAIVVRRLNAGIFFVTGAVGITCLALNVDADVEGFLVSAFVLMWLIAGIGLDGVVSWLGRSGRPGQALAMCVVVVMPIWQLRDHYKVNDHHLRTFETDYLNALFARLENRVAIVREAYPVDQMIYYKLAAEHAEGGRTVVVIPADALTVAQYADDGYAIYAFSETRALLERRGFNFERVQLSQPARESEAGAPIDMGPLPLFKVTRHALCQPVANQGWQDISRVARSGRLMLRIDNYRPFDSDAILYVAGTAEVPPSLTISQGPSPPSVSVRTFHTGSRDQAEALRSIIGEDGLTAPALVGSSAVVHRLQLRVNDRGAFSVAALALGGVPASAWIRASTDLSNPMRATACGWSGRDLLEGTAMDVVDIGPGGDLLFGQGWSVPERESDFELRRAPAGEAEVLVPLATVKPIHLRLFVRTIDGSEATLSATVNDDALPGLVSVGREWDVVEFSVPQRALRFGFNRVALRVTHNGDRAPAGFGLRGMGLVVTEH